jgi:hypothetical protein
MADMSSGSGVVGVVGVVGAPGALLEFVKAQQEEHSPQDEHS